MCVVIFAGGNDGDIRFRLGAIGSGEATLDPNLGSIEETHEKELRGASRDGVVNGTMRTHCHYYSV